MATPEYQRRRSHERMALARERIGGKCAKCGATEVLEFDHINPETKLANISEIANWSLARFLAEVDKCQILCWDCHAQKTIAECYVGPAPVDHGGGLTGKRNCPCGLCRDRRRIYFRNRKRRRSTPRPAPQHGERRMYIAGCRCDPCKASQREYMQAYRNAKGGLASPVGKVVEAVL